VLVAGIDSYAKEAGALVVKIPAMRAKGLDGLSRGIVACGTEKGQYDVLPRD